MRRQSLTKAQSKMTALSWEPTVATAAARFGTDGAVRQHCEDLCRSLRDDPVSAGLTPKASASLSPGPDDRDDLVSRTDGMPCRRDHDTAAGELQAISPRMPDLTHFDVVRRRYRPLVESSVDVAREPYCVGSPVDVSVMVPDSLSFCGLDRASSRMRRRVDA
jgi:hypothetical protein